MIDFFIGEKKHFHLASVRGRVTEARLSRKDVRGGSLKREWMRGKGRREDLPLRHPSRLPQESASSGTES